ncbi:MAG TPA: malto-oligosyltrehalose synthase [Acidobacteriaceae bacterium]|nr:malto-oligosyltrehalose synthase [Acidobacteriaceae bacterium]
MSAADVISTTEQDISIQQCLSYYLQAEARVPSSTYRVQLHRSFNFANLESLLPYLKRLGIGDCYLSPIFEARPGSTHGYDVTRHDRINPELGGDAGFARLTQSMRAAGVGRLLDIVPNHMGVGNDSLWWQDVLENGRASQYAEFFDIDWDPLKTDMQGKLLLPILGAQYGEELENKHIQIVIEDGVPKVRYYDHSMPLAPRSLPMIFTEEEIAELPQRFRDLLRELSHIPPNDTSYSSLATQRRAQLKEIKPRIREALRRPHNQAALAAALERVNGILGDPDSFDRLHEVLEAQPYRLAFWRVSGEEINYRRFFDVNDLVGLRMENPEVFAATHCLIRKMLAEGQVTGLRVDHCDGMFNPRQYLIRLQLLYIASQCCGPSPQDPVAPNGIESAIREAVRGYDWSKVHGPLYVVVEKILEPREVLPGEWPVHGTSGYDFIYFANQIFIQQESRKRFTDLYTAFTGRTSDPAEIIYRAKLQVMQNALASETYVLTNLLSQLGSADRRARDFTDSILEDVIRETIACFPVYRTYIDDRGQYTERDRTFIRHAISRAKYRNPDLDASAFDFLENILLLHGKTDAEINSKELYFAVKFQQLTGPVMAKGVEDTAFYVYNRFISSNEVGSSMQSFGIPIEIFHTSNEDRLRNSPDAMLATSTHDTKRSEDVRNRLNVISEMKLLWPAFVRRVQRLNARFKQTLEDGRVAPDLNEEYLIYQTIAGAWPWEMESPEDRRQFIERLQQYMTKALSEAKVNLSWVSPNEKYAAAVHKFVAGILTPDADGTERKFVNALQLLLPALKLFGAVNSIAQVVLKATSPGVPDFYQGSEMWDLSLVDPDNRRPVDYKVRIDALDALLHKAETEGPLAVCREVAETFDDGRIKLWTTHRALAVRTEYPEVFRRGEYTALYAEDDYTQHVIAYLRRQGEQCVLAAVPRFACTLMRHRSELPLGNAWGEGVLLAKKCAGMHLRNAFTGEGITVPEDGRIPLARLFAHYPVAMCAAMHLDHL